VNQGKLVFDGFHKIAEIECEVKGQMVKREKLLVKGAVAGIVIDEDNRIGLVSQYRPVIKQQTKEIPAGVLDKDDLTAKEILIEELMEECEIPKHEILSVSEKPTHEYFMMSGNADGKIYFYEIHVKRQENKTVQDVDVDSVEWVGKETMQRYIQEGQIVDGKTILAYYYWLTKDIDKKIEEAKEQGKQELLDFLDS
jgi:ADP-ribose pyrophosphatase